MLTLWKPSASFSGGISSSARALSRCAGSGICTRMPWICGIVVGLSDGLFQLLLRGILRHAHGFGKQSRAARRPFPCCPRTAGWRGRPRPESPAAPGIPGRIASTRTFNSVSTARTSLCRLKSPWQSLRFQPFAHPKAGDARRVVRRVFPARRTRRPRYSRAFKAARDLLPKQRGRGHPAHDQRLPRVRFSQHRRRSCAPRCAKGNRTARRRSARGEIPRLASQRIHCVSAPDRWQSRSPFAMLTGSSASAFPCMASRSSAAPAGNGKPNSQRRSCPQAAPRGGPATGPAA